jgi:hypothetical protein
MDALLTLNIFALSLPVALAGAALFGALITWPFLLARSGGDDEAERCPRARWAADGEAGCRSAGRPAEA